jgi:spermidine synthase
VKKKAHLIGKTIKNSKIFYAVRANPDIEIVREVQQTMRSVFPVVDLYTAPITTYAGNWWSFSVGSKKLDPREIRGRNRIRTHYYSSGVHAMSFMPKDMYERLLAGRLPW